MVFQGSLEQSVPALVPSAFSPIVDWLWDPFEDQSKMLCTGGWQDGEPDFRVET